MKDSQLLQRAYYKQTADLYDDQHLCSEPEHTSACRFISAFMPMLGASTVLDVGCGTGRALGLLRGLNPNVTVHGIEPVEAMLQKAVVKLGPSGLCIGDGFNLPFRNNSYDIVIEAGVLHHVARPDRLVGEMMRVARKAVFLSDHNIFGQGSGFVRFVKWILFKARLWRLIKTLQHGGRSYHQSAGDGLAFSYSVYFQYRLLEQWATTIAVVPTTVSNLGELGFLTPLFGSPEVLLCAFRENLADVTSARQHRSEC